MRDSDLTDKRKEMPDMAVIRRMRAPRRLRVESADRIFFDVAAFKLDRLLGIPEHTAVERNLTVTTIWPEILL